MQPVITQTPRGTKVIYFQEPKAHLFTVCVNFNVGALNEKKRKYGIAHFLEHMAFAGTSKMTAKEFSAAVEGIGGEMNAMTGYEDTCYHITCMPEHSRNAIQLIGHILTDPTFPEEELEKERKVILQERVDRNDEPYGVLWSSTFRGIYGATGRMGTDIVGSAEEIKNITREDLSLFIRENYCRARATVYLYGNIGIPQWKFKSLLKEIDNSLLLNETESRITEFPGATKKAKGTIKATSKFESFYGSISSIIEDEELHPEKIVNRMVLSELIGGGYTSVLYEKIRQDLGLVYSVGSSTWELQNEKYFISTVSCGSLSNLHKALKIIHETYDNMPTIVEHSNFMIPLRMVQTRLARRISSYMAKQDMAFELAKQGVIIDPEKLLKIASKVTRGDVMAEAERYSKGKRYETQMTKKEA